MQRRLISFLFFVVAILISFNLSARKKKTLKGTGNSTEKKLSYLKYNELEFKKGFNVTIIQSDKYKIVVNYDNIYKDVLQISKKAERIVFDIEGKYEYKKAILDVKVYTPVIKRIIANGKSRISLAQFRTPTLDFDLHGETVVYANLDISDKIMIKGEGVGKFFIEGKTNKLELNINGNMKFESDKLEVVNNFVINASGTCFLDIKAMGKILLNTKGITKINNYGVGNISILGTDGTFQYNTIRD